jgi:hypothetical protein
MSRKYIAIFHANLNYAFLVPECYERVIRASYEVIIDGFTKHPGSKYIFEASGYTIEQMALLTPDVLEKLKVAIQSGQCEFMGAPYSHPIMANVPEEDGYWSCEFAMRTFEKYLGFRPESFWNPECTWMQYVPRAFRRAGVKYLALDFESYMNCNDKDYAWVERNAAHDMNWGGLVPGYDLDPSCKFLHRPFRDVVPGLHGFCRSDRLVNKYLSYFRGATTVDEFIENMLKWSGTEKEGATVIVADDAEYCGTTGYYFIKYKADYTQTFKIDPTAPEKLDKLIAAVMKVGEFITFKEACETIPPVEEPFYVEDRFAWHRTYSDAWANTPEARAWEPVLEAHRKEYKQQYQPVIEAPENRERFKALIEKFWFHMTNSANSDGRWPPPPRVTCDFNREWCLEEMRKTREALDEIKAAMAEANLRLPENGEYVAPPPNDWRYGYHFTDKNPEDVRKLNLYELHHAIYYANKMAECGLPDKTEEGKKLLIAVFDELDRRGRKGSRPAAISGKRIEKMWINSKKE